MPDVARDPAALELLRTQRRRLAERMRPPWWYVAGIALLYTLVFAVPFGQRYLPQGVRMWPIFLAVVVLACLLEWGLGRATGIKTGSRNLLYPASGRPVRIAVVTVCLAALVAEHFLVDRSLIAAAIVVAAFGVAAEVALLQAAVRGIRQELRGGGGAT
ncbi:MAG TPA: hypothetical protein VMC03_01900 [Streptosporangiaceae bacterium]|nr:hypothetical protein [Streptosporangiaceae bacterium]